MYSKVTSRNSVSPRASSVVWRRLLLASSTSWFAHQIIPAIKPIVGEILGGDAADEETARLSSFSILGQCAFYLYSHVLVARFYPERYLKPETIERVARHIAQFSFGALKELKK